MFDSSMLTTIGRSIEFFAPRLDTGLERLVLEPGRPRLVAGGELRNEKPGLGEEGDTGEKSSDVLLPRSLTALLRRRLQSVDSALE